jgi:hypothetical protein
MGKGHPRLETKAEVEARLLVIHGQKVLDEFRSEFARLCEEQGGDRDKAMALIRRRPEWFPKTAGMQPQDASGLLPSMAEAIGGMLAPAHWGELPDEGKPEEDAKWVYQQYAAVVIRKPGKPVVLRLERASRKPPSKGAVGLLQWAAENWTAFYDKVWMRFARGAEGEEEDRLRQHRKSVAEIERILAQLSESAL